MTHTTRRSFLKHTSALGALPLAGWPLPPGRDRPLYVDGLSFLPYDLEDIPKSGLDAFVLDVSKGRMVDTDDGRKIYRRTFEECARAVTAMRRRLREIDSVFFATKGSDIAKARETGTTAVFFQIQGCDFVEKDLSRIDLFYELGLRVLQITHHFDNSVGGGALEREASGLTQRGVRAVERMNELGLIPDLSHASDETALDVLEVSERPVVLSHGAARALVPNARCAPDEVIRGIAESGGVVGIFMMSFWLTTAPVPKVEHLIAQLRHVIDVGGIDSVGIANDYPISGEAGLAALGNDNAQGVKNYLPWWRSIAKDGILGFDVEPQHVVIPELNDTRRMFTIHEALDEHGFGAAEVEKILGGNWVRVLTECLG